MSAETISFSFVESARGIPRTYSAFRLANKALSTCKAYQHAEEDLEKKVAIVETVWVKLETQLKFLRRIANQGHLKDELAQCHFTLLQKLNGTLLQAVSQLEMAARSIESNPRAPKFFKIGKWRYAVIKKTLDTLMVELEAWQGRFDPSWYLIILMSGSVLDRVLVESHEKQTTASSAAVGPLDNMRALRRAIDAEHSIAMRNPDRLDLDVGQLFHETNIMPYTTAKVMVRPGSSERLITEPVDLSTVVNSQSISDIERLVRRLQHIDPDTFGILQCEGILRKTDAQSGRLTALHVVYRAPFTTQPPRTLRQLLLSQTDVSLSAIINLPKQLVRSVSYIHACDFVHKNIRPRNILLFPSSDCPIGSAYLLGLTQFRSLAHHTNLLGDPAWHRNLYRHPARQGLRILDSYVMQHDIYSLGVCLLEIGLWRSLVWYPTMENASLAVPVPGLALASLRNVLTDKVFERAHVGNRTGWIKEDLVGMAKKLLPARMGDMYTRIVENCLTCLDEGNEDFGAFTEEEGVDGVALGVRYIEKILSGVTDINL
ncbi:hypothetical protein NEMBOFW57_004623 [Staphylotrichum longicolle]|uniref:Protein kinase domain-containing protein n=1 Tax=Staphylotrichum longicolle TaxID=669026 RepID=A0AAD4FC17_9PEZI|nr:hypothetical protein NEMBOFW57_004623 [Staphylotrichum longicolle]